MASPQIGEMISHHETSKRIPEAGEQTGRKEGPKLRVLKTRWKDKEIDSQKLVQAADEYRRLASLLNAGFRLVPFYPFTRVVFLLPKESEIINARNYLLEMSEEIFAAPKSFVIAEKRKNIEKLLKVI